MLDKSGSDAVLYISDGPVVRLTLNRPDKLNPLDWSTVRALARLVARAEADPAIRVAVITGAGRAFSAGGDLAGYVSLYHQPDDFRAFLADFAALNAAIERSRIIWIAAVNGACVAGGLELLLACDLSIAAAEARIGDGHANFGQLPGAGGSQRLPRAIGALRARHLMTTGDMIDGREAERIGLVGAVTPRAELENAVDALIAKLLDKSPAGLAAMKRLVAEGMSLPLDRAIALEIETVHRWATQHPDAMEGLLAFGEKRKPRFSGSGH
ncbi:MAG: enoyl-CoA hydratase/isomerase family protein [Alphaproteobacteria bacterium]|nr:enoyl-CoA hydratase/isomerase family protein [Alphaproteobacteria bacterium]